MPTISRDPDRLILFTDAVVAIAITLLVLPLVDLANEPVAEPSEVITTHWPQIGSFALSFVVIARLWLVHHRTFQHVRAYTPSLVLWNMAWVFTVVVLPFPTDLVGGPHGTDPFTLSFYIGTILASSCCQAVLIVLIHRRPEIQEEDNPLQPQYVAVAVASTVMLLLALLLALIVPQVSYYGLLALLFARPLVRLWLRARGAA